LIFTLANLRPEHALISLAEIQQFFGSDATAAGIRFQFATRIKDDVKLLKQARNEGKDCKDVELGGSAKCKCHKHFLDLCSCRFPYRPEPNRLLNFF
jgi:hypothetical protein